MPRFHSMKPPRRGLSKVGPSRKQRPITKATFRSNPLSAYRTLARLSGHCGVASFLQGGVNWSGPAEFLLPASGHAIIALRTQAGGSPARDFGHRLLIEGRCEQGPFRIDCPQVYVCEAPNAGGWSLISPVNAPATFRYGAPRPAARAAALLNTFDFTNGDRVQTPDGGLTHIGPSLRLAAGDRPVTLSHHPDRTRLRPILKAGLLHTASLVQASFDVTPGESDDQLLAFCSNISALCTLGAGAGVSLAMIDLRDSAGTLLRRIVPRPVTSRYRGRGVVEDVHLPRLFSECFPELVRMTQAHAPWVKLQSYCGWIEDSAFLEQKFASLSMAIEYFIRNSLTESGRPDSEVRTLDFPSLIGAARKHLGWDIPKHYAANDTVRLLRNAVMHGAELPTKDSAQFRLLFDKWKLFLFRRVLIRLGYRGQVISPHRGWESTSHVADFTEERNVFTPEEPDGPDAS